MIRSAKELSNLQKKILTSWAFTIVSATETGEVVHLLIPITHFLPEGLVFDCCE
jgi:hypothetical protein